MKRVTILIAVFLAAIVYAWIGSPGDAVADHPDGAEYTGACQFSITVDSTVAKQYDTVDYKCDLTGGVAGDSSRIFLDGYVKDYSTVVSRVMVEYTAVDTGTGGVAVDTTKDTVIVIVKTSDGTLSASKEVRRDTLTDFHVTASVAEADYVWRTLSDSVLGGNVYYEFVAIVQDSTYTKARLAADLHYKATIHTWLK